MESKSRSLTKTISWRMIATFTTFLISWAISGSVVIGLSIASIEFWAKLILYYMHERVWNAIDWGTK